MQYFLKFLAFVATVAFASCDWNFGSLVNRNKDSRSIVPQHDYSSSLSELDRFLAQLDLFPMMSHISANLPMDIRESKDAIDVHMDIPGVDKKDITISIHKNNEVVVSAHKQAVVKSEGQMVRRTERYSGNMTRTLVLPSYADTDKMEAEYNSGVLYLKIPKTVQEAEECAKTILVK